MYISSEMDCIFKSAVGSLKSFKARLVRLILGLNKQISYQVNWVVKNYQRVISSASLKVTGHCRGIEI